MIDRATRNTKEGERTRITRVGDGKSMLAKSYAKGLKRRRNGASRNYASIWARVWLPSMD